MIDFESRLKGGILGLVVGDALGVPVEFMSRHKLQEKPVSDMIGYGAHNQPAGTWSDDSSMTFCTVESLCKGYNLKDIADNFVKWRYESHWTPYGVVFDIGITTTKAIINYQNLQNPHRSGLTDERSNGNGSLMRILPMAFYLKDHTIESRFNIVKEVSSLTHAHIRSVISCFIYTELAIELLNHNNRFTAFKHATNTVSEYLKTINIDAKEYARFTRVLNRDILHMEERSIQTSGYVIDSLEASLWCFFTTDSYEEAVLKAVNLGSDTDTTACITGGIAGIYYGDELIPKKWTKKIARENDINSLILEYYGALQNLN